MKKIYEKPLLAIENFMVSQHIAACTEAYANNIEIVKKDLMFLGYFSAEDNCGNTLLPGTIIQYDGVDLCYHTSVATATLFSS